MEMEAETGGTQPPAQGRREPPELEEAGRTLPGACGGSGALEHLDLRGLASRMGEGECLLEATRLLQPQKAHMKGTLNVQGDVEHSGSALQPPRWHPRQTRRLERCI